MDPPINKNDLILYLIDYHNDETDIDVDYHKGIIDYI